MYAKRIKGPNRQVDIIHRVGIKAPLQKVYEALSTVEGISGWWTEQTSGTSQIGKTIVVNFFSLEGKELGSMNMAVKALDPGKKFTGHSLQDLQNGLARKRYLTCAKKMIIR